MEKQERVGLILAQCQSAEPFHTHDDAFNGINELIDTIEDEWSPEPYDHGGRSRNRIYGPSKVFAQATQFDGLIAYGHVGHVTMIYRNGAFMIMDRREKVLLDKPGADGRYCPR